MDFEGLEFLVVGAGLSGLTVARQLADKGRKVAIVERRLWLGGLCASFTTGEGIEVHRHGTHVLHSSDQKAIEFLSRFCQLNHYRHRVFSYHAGRMFPLPINLETINKFYGTDLDPKCGGKILKLYTPCCFTPTNFEEAVIAKMGRALYSAFIEGYTRKHWGIDPRLLPIWLADRIPVRTDYNGDYFQDFWQGVPIRGYNSLFTSICRGITAHLGVDFREIRTLYPSKIKVVYTGSLDGYFNHRFGRLPWRGVSVVTETRDVPDFQGTAVVNFPDESVPQTRVHEFRHLHPERHAPNRTIIAPEFPSVDGEPAYPMAEDGTLAKQYRAAAALEPNVFFCGRMATYRYLNMDQAVSQALELADTLCKTTT